MCVSPWSYLSYLLYPYGTVRVQYSTVVLLLIKVTSSGSGSGTVIAAKKMKDRRRTDTLSRTRNE